MVDVKNAVFADISGLGKIIFEERCVAKLVSLLELLYF